MRLANNGKIWSKSEFEQIRLGKRRKLTLAIIASKLGRSKSAVQRKAYAVGIRLDALPMTQKTKTKSRRKTTARRKHH